MPYSTRHEQEARGAAAWRRFVRCSLAIGLIAVGLTGWPRFDFWRRSRFAEELAGYAERSPDGPAAATVRRLAEGGLAALDSLVRLAGSGRPAVASAAQNALSDGLTSWDMQYRAVGDQELLAEQLGALAEALARRADDFDLSARPWADRCALEILERSDRLAATSSVAVIGWCEGVLAESPTLGATRRLVAPAEATTEVVRSTRMDRPALNARPALVGAPVVAAAPLTAAPEVPSGHPSDLAVIREPSEAPTVLESASERVGSEFSHAAVAPTEPVETIRLDAVETAPTAPHDFAVVPQALPSPPGDREVVDVPSPHQVRVKLRRYRQESSAELAGRLSRSTTYEALAIRHVLREREAAGGTLAKHETVRRSSGGSQGVFDGLAKLPAAEARVQLRRLVQDADPEVRLRALTLLATSRDPQLEEIVRRRAVVDADPRVAELATRIMRGEVK